MKKQLTVFIFLIFSFLIASGQTKNNAIDNKKAIENIKFVFDDYVEYQESTDSQDDKDLMVKSIESLGKITNLKDLEVLINVWMYYDPTDFPNRHLVFKILKESKPESIKAVKLRMINKKEWETNDTGPYSELNDLLKQLDR